MTNVEIKYKFSYPDNVLGSTPSEMAKIYAENSLKIAMEEWWKNNFNTAFKIPCEIKLVDDVKINIPVKKQECFDFSQELLYTIVIYMAEKKYGEFDFVKNPHLFRNPPSIREAYNSDEVLQLQLIPEIENFIIQERYSLNRHLHRLNNYLSNNVFKYHFEIDHLKDVILPHPQ